MARMHRPNCSGFYATMVKGALTLCAILRKYVYDAHTN